MTDKPPRAMHRYTLRFTATSLDESRLRDVLEREFRLSAIAIIRDGPEPGFVPVEPPQPTNEMDAFLLKCLANHKPWRRKALIQKALPTSSLNAILRALVRLESSGAIRKIRHGVLIAADAPEGADAEIPPMNMDIERPNYEKAVEMLKEPRSAGELREALKVSRQRIDQIVKKMMRDKKVRRFEVAGQKGDFLYILSEYFDKEALLTRSPILRSPRDRLLSSLSPGTLCRAADLSLVALSSTPKLREYLEQLSALGLILTFKLGQHTYVGVTPRGLEHPQYDAAAPKCEAANLLSDFGEARVKFVQHLELLGPARTVDLTYAMPKGYFEGKATGSGQIIQGLEHAGIIEKAEAKEGRHALYALTAKGRFLSGIFARINPLPSVDQLRQVISERHREKAERLRSLGLKNISSNAAVGSPTQAAIVRALEQGRPLTTTEITSTMDTKFKNPRSIHLALRRLYERGIIQLAGIGPRNENIWYVAEQHEAANAARP